MSNAPPALVDAQRSMHAAITGTSAISERLAIYRRAYYERLLSCMRAEYPVLLHLLGRETFDTFATTYIQACPPRSYTLADLGSRFAGWLDETRPSSESWPNLIIDLARLERAFIEVYDGPPGPREMTFRYPVAEYFHAVRAGEDPPVPDPRETHITLSRPSLVVKVEVR